MRACALLASLIFLLSWPAAARQSASGKATSATPRVDKPGSDPALTNLLDSKVHEEWDAFKRKDRKAYGDLLDDDYVCVEADGDGERTKTRMLREIQHSQVTEYTLSFLKVTPLGPDAAFVRYEAFFKFPPKSAVPYEKVLIGEIWVKRGRDWKSLHYQETRVK